MAKNSIADNMKVIEKIPLFQGLSVNQVRNLLDAGQMATRQKGSVLCKEGDKSTDMFILLSGELTITRRRTGLATVTPVDIVGEMGFITSQPRSAKVEVSKNSTVVTINKLKFDVVLKKDPDSAVKIYKSMLQSVCGKLREANARLAGEIKSSDGVDVASMV